MLEHQEKINSENRQALAYAILSAMYPKKHK